MAINILNENDYIKCNKCGSNTFYKKDIYALKKIKIKNENKIQTIPTNRVFKCSVCGENIEFKIVGGDILEYNN